MRILICSPENNQATGNWVTATRYLHDLERWGHQVTLCHIPPEGDALNAAITDSQPDLLLLLHAFRTGRPWLEGGHGNALPTVVMLSGTDINEGLLDAAQAPVVEQVMMRADALLVHNPLVAEELRLQHPRLATRLHHLPPGIEIGATPYALRQPHDIPARAALFLCPASIRPVKGVLALIDLFDQLPARPERWQLAFCGAVLDPDYARRFFAAVEQRPSVHYLGTIPPAAMADALNQADVIMNNSISEGLPNALIEAASLGRPILARDIPGNRPIVDHGINGLLYHDHHSFASAAQRLIDDAELRRRLSQPRPERYHPDHEAELLHRVCTEVLERWENRRRTQNRVSRPQQPGIQG